MADADWRTTLRDARVVEVKKKKRATAASSVPNDGKTRRKKPSGGALYALGIAEHRVLGGVAKAANDYLKRSKKSAAARRDGAVRDLLDNLGKSQEKAIGQLAKIPMDVIKSPQVKRGTKRLRRTLRRLTW